MHFLINLLNIIYLTIKKGGIPDKVMAYSLAAVLNIPFTFLVEKYIFNDWEMLGYITILLAADTVSGFVKHWKSGTVSSEGFSKFFTKLFIIAVGLVVTHVLTSISLERANETVGDYLQTLCYSTIVVYITISLVENLSDLSGGRFPPIWVRKHLKRFERTGRLDKPEDIDLNEEQP